MRVAIPQESLPRSPEQACALLSAEMDRHGFRGRLSLHCHPDRPDQIMCMIDLQSGDAGKAAGLLGGFVFGFGTVVVFLPLSGDFSCKVEERTGDRALPHMCSCRPGLRR